MQQYWSGRCFYNVARDDMIDHPDQRICEDVNHFTSRACSLLMKVGFVVGAQGLAASVKSMS